MDELELAIAARGGDLNAFNRLVLIHQELAYNLAYRILSDPDSAEDATQLAMIAAYNNIKGFRGGSFKAWLLRIVTNQCYDELRRQKRQPRVSLEPVSQEDDEEIESPNWLADDNPSPEETIVTAELETAIQHCLNDLPDEFRMIVVMVDVEGLDYMDVSRAINRPLGTVKSRLARARLRLQGCLREYRELLPEKFRLEDEAE
ncbi:MAG: sigma-70 family RNA polymerase sigma factor [Chloroflexi bacterium]|nr:sigma-70 family RNA polymerase sigma factor [Chloroflexota bacterium]